jgi:hypothetical protein
MHTSTTALSSHLEKVHKILKETDPKTARTTHPSLIAKWLKNQSIVEYILFEDALLDWIIYTCQPFIIIIIPFNVLFQSETM